MKLDLYINVDPPLHEIGRATVIPEKNRKAPITKSFFNIPIGGILYRYFHGVNICGFLSLISSAKKGTGSKSLLSYGYYFISGSTFNMISLNFLSSQTETGLNSFSDWKRSSLIAWFITTDPLIPDTDL